MSQHCKIYGSAVLKTSPSSETTVERERPILAYYQIIDGKPWAAGLPINNSTVLLVVVLVSIVSAAASDQTLVFAAELLLQVRKNCLSISRIFTALLRIGTEQILQLDGEYRREFSHKWRKVSRTLRAPTDKALCQSFVGVAGTTIEKRHCFPAARFSFKKRQQMDRNDRVPITHHGVPAQRGLILSKPN